MAKRRTPKSKWSREQVELHEKLAKRIDEIRQEILKIRMQVEFSKTHQVCREFDKVEKSLCLISAMID